MLISLSIFLDAETTHILSNKTNQSDEQHYGYEKNYAPTNGLVQENSSSEKCSKLEQGLRLTFIGEKMNMPIFKMDK